MKKIKLSILAAALVSQTFALDLNLKKITVTTATKFPQPLLETTSNIKVITSDEIELRGYKTISEILLMEPGIGYKRNGGLGQTTSIFLRGFETSKTLVLVDGVRYNNPTSLNGAEFEHIMVENIKKIEIIKGPQSGIWGADATAGVINIITKDAEKTGFNLSLHGELGTFNTQTYGINSNYTHNIFDLALNLSKVKTDGFSAAIKDGKDLKEFEDDGYKNSSADIKLGFNISQKDRVEIFYNLIDSKTQYDGYDGNFTINPDDNTQVADSKSKFYGLNYKRDANLYQTKIYLNSSKFSRKYSYGNFDGKIDEIGFNTLYRYIEDSFIVGGIDYKKISHDNAISKEYTNSGLFLTNSNKIDGFISGSTIFSQSLRYDKFDAFDDKFTYKIGLKHIHDRFDGLIGSINYATAYNTPSLYQLYDPYVGYKNLNPEETQGFDLTVEFRGASLTYFKNRVKNMIEYDIATSKYRNVNKKSKIDGIELYYKNMIDSISLSYSLNYTYLDAKYRAKNSANLSLDYYPIKSVHIGGTFRYVGKRGDIKKLDSYTVADLITSYSINNQISIYAKVNNLLDKKYQEISGYATSTRALYFGFRYKIK